MFVLQLNSAFSCLLQTPPDLSAHQWTTKAPHFHCFPAICMLATFAVCILAFLAGWNSSQCFYPLYTIYRDQNTGSEFMLAQRAMTDVPAAFAHTPGHLQLSKCPRQMPNSKVKKLPADGKSRMRGKNVPNAAVSTVVTIWWFNFSFLTSPRKCVLNRRQLYKRQLCCALINLFCKGKAPRKYSCRKRLESKSERLQGSEEAACWFIVCCSFI